jgi:uncharacterized protein
MSEALNLFRLQQLDTAIDKAKSRLDEIERILSDNQFIKRARNKFAIAQSETKKIRIKLNQIEDKVEAQRIKRKNTQNALFGGKVKNPKELQDLQMESEALKRYITQLEDEQLEAMIANEEAVKAEKIAEKALKQAEGTTAEENAALLGEQSKLEDDLKKFIREKEAVLQSLSPDSLKLYQNLRKRKKGSAVATVSEGGCSICGQALTPANLQAIRTSNHLVFCPSCNRILYEG